MIALIEASPSSKMVLDGLCVQRGSFYEYLEVDMATSTVGALVIHGWTPPPWGQLSTGVAHASLDALVKIGVLLEDLEPVMNEVFNTHPGVCHYDLLEGGALRKVSSPSVA